MTTCLRRAAVAGLALTIAASASSVASGQWLNQPTPGIPRDAERDREPAGARATHALWHAGSLRRLEVGFRSQRHARWHRRDHRPPLHDRYDP